MLPCCYGDAVVAQHVHTAVFCGLIGQPEITKFNCEIENDNKTSFYVICAVVFFGRGGVDIKQGNRWKRGMLPKSILSIKGRSCNQKILVNQDMTKKTTFYEKN